MELLSLPEWTLSASVYGGVVEFGLGDGRRLAWRSRCPVERLSQAGGPIAAAALLGEELARHLSASEPRRLNIQFDESLDDVAWEALGLGAETLAQRFAIGRQLLSDTESPVHAEAVLDDELVVAAVLEDAAPSLAGASRVPTAALEYPWAREAVAAAHVIALPGLSLEQLFERTGRAGRPRLFVLRGCAPPRELACALDDGAAVLSLGTGHDLDDDGLGILLAQLATGASVGEAARSMHRRAMPECLQARLYGNPGMRFVRTRAHASQRQVTSLSYDIVQSTAMLARLGAESFATKVLRLHALCANVVRRKGGLHNDPHGKDGAMCYFGWPSALEDAAARAIETGLAIIESAALLGVSVRVGIATDDVLIDADQPWDLSIHFADRLQKAAAPDTLLVADSTRRLVPEAFEFRAVRDLPVLQGFEPTGQGRGRPLVHLVLGRRRDLARHRLDQVPRLTPLVGREQELVRLMDCWQRTRAGDARTAVVAGEAGMGKSRLVHEFRQRLRGDDVTVLECHCRADASASPYLVLTEALRRWLCIGVDDEKAEAQRKLSAALPAAARHAEILDLLATFLGLEPPRPAPPPAAGLRQRLLGTLLDWFVAFAARSPCCLIVEDWHWIDPSTRDFVEQLAALRGASPLMTVITVRAERAPALPGEADNELIELGRLGPEDARELVDKVCGATPLRAGVARKLAARGDGVPLFLEEAARMALEGGADRVDSLEAVPASLKGLLTERLDGLGDARPVAQVAAVLGRGFSLEMLTPLFQAPPFVLDTATLAECLEALVKSGLVRAEAGGRFEFKHALVRDAAYELLSTRDRRTLHGRVVQLLQQRWPELAAPQPELLARHQAEAGLHRDALAQWIRAASDAAARSAELEAITHLRRAFAALEKLEPGIERDRTTLRVQLMFAGRLIATEGYGSEAVLQAYLEAQRLCDRLGDETVRFKIEMGLEANRFMRADFAPALEHGKRAAAIAARSGDLKQRLHAHWGLACTLFHQGNLRATMREMETALAIYSPAMHPQFGIQDPGVMCMAYSSWGLWEMGRPDDALARIDRAVALAAEFRHKFSQAVAMAYGTSIAMLRGETVQALARAAECIEVCEDAGFPVWLAITRCMRGRLLCEQGQFELGLGEMRAGSALWLATGAKVSQPLYLSLQAEGLMLAGHGESAQVCVDEGLAIVDRYGERQLEAELRRLGGELALRRDCPDEAEDSFRRAFALAMRQHRLGFALRAATSLSRLWAADGRAERARRVLAPLVARWQQGMGTRDVRVARELSQSLA